MDKTQETILEIDLNAVTHNLKYLKSKLQSKTKFLAVVKAFAYGSDAEQIALHLQDLDVDYFAVAYTSEGVVLRDAGITKPILVLHPQPINFKTIIDRCLEPSLYSARVLKTFIECTKKEKQTNYPIHIKFNTGLNRLGFWENDIDFIHTQLKETNSVKVASVFSHLAASEDLQEKEFTNTQISCFTNTSKKLVALLGYHPMLHLCNTSGILNYPEAHLDMVRCGIGLYGFGNSKEESKNLKPIAALKSVISQIHLIEKGETVGYNRAFKSEKKLKTATVPIGHADGIGRHFGNENGFVFVNNAKCNIIGNVCMDMIMIDVTNVDCNEGDEIIIFNNQHTAEHLAEAIDTISYELITSISRRIKRKFTK
ncbi:alanine racemase [Pontimicrobium aquaticum]|uniref:Alanine racemase n=1 Tax=Pontimicrobium aquaticum TaxID=2565367 RepID=A0A4U0F1V0_9FLAO|nr:alanine racemase [Pontimicrobium aquaticum]TJY38228.1 alanine racemase [Pontimicrobium aquaticum]